MLVRILYLSIFLFSLCVASGQTVQSTCLASDSVVKLYKTDAYRLALRRSYKVNSTYKDSIKIDPTLRTNYLRALLAVYNATTLPGRDTVCKYFKIHTLGYPDLSSLLLQGDTSKSWMHDFKNNIFPTSNSTINGLLSIYSFTRTSYTPFPSGDLVGFDTDSCWNITAYASKFSTIPGVYLAGSNAFVLDGWDLTDSINPNYIELNYKMAWGDCPSGCIYHKIWKFRVYNDCSVSYAGTYGSSVLDFFTGLKKTNSGSTEEFKIFPNPCNGKLWIHFEVNNVEKLKLEILSSRGESIMISDFVNELDVSSLKNGLYILRLNDGKFNKNVRFIKE